MEKLQFQWPVFSGYESQLLHQRIEHNPFKIDLDTHHISSHREINGVQKIGRGVKKSKFLQN